jgi:hypothetical protein
MVEHPAVKRQLPDESRVEKVGEFRETLSKVEGQS